MEIGTYEYSHDTSMHCGMPLLSGRYVGDQVEPERHIPRATQKKEQRSLSMDTHPLRSLTLLGMRSAR